MSKVIVSRTDQVAPGAFPALTGVAADADGIESRGVVVGEDRSLLAWVHTLPPNAAIRFTRPPVGHVLYVWEGGAAADGEAMESGAVLAVEHKGEATLRAGSGGAKLVHYHQREAGAQPARAGGNVHVVGKDGIFSSHHPQRNGKYTLWLDSTCPTCELWLHSGAFTGGFPQGGAHYHTEDEIIFVVEGGMVLGRNTYPPGTALAIDARKVYGYGMPATGGAFINFRPSNPFMVPMSREGPKSPPRSEWDALHSLPALPADSR